MNIFLPIVGIMIAIFCITFVFKKFFRLTNASAKSHDEAFKRDNDEFNSL